MKQILPKHSTVPVLYESRVGPCRVSEMGTFLCMDSSSGVLWLASLGRFCVRPSSDPNVLLALSLMTYLPLLSLPPTRDISIAMAVSSHVIHQVHGVMGQLFGALLPSGSPS